MDDKLEVACEVMHDAYEKAAFTAGWETNPASREPWANVPESNKVAMRHAVQALLGYIAGWPCSCPRCLNALPGTARERYL